MLFLFYYVILCDSLIKKNYFIIRLKIIYVVHQKKNKIDSLVNFIDKNKGYLNFG